MPYNLAEAAAATGKSKTTILRAIRNGLISAQRAIPGGGWEIEPVELHRVYPRVTGAPDVTRDETIELRHLQARLEDAHSTIEDLRRRLDTEVDDLRRRLDQESEERRQAQALVTALLRDQRSTATTHDPIPVIKPEAPKGRWFQPWWRRRSL